MARVVILGGGGTLGRALQQHIRSQAEEVEILVWNRRENPLTDFPLVRDRLSALSPDLVFNLAVASESTGQLPAPWEEETESVVINERLPLFLNELSREQGFRLVHTSSVMVFDDSQEGPFSPESVPKAVDGYGAEKRRAEEGVLSTRGSTVVARIGWQIGSDPTANTMRRFVAEQIQQNQGVVRASSQWFPACSRLEETARVLWNLRDSEPGLYQVDSNRNHSFFEILRRLKEEWGDDSWTLEPDDAFTGVQCMLDERLDTRPLFEEL